MLRSGLTLRSVSHDLAKEAGYGETHVLISELFLHSRTTVSILTLGVRLCKMPCIYPPPHPPFPLYPTVLCSVHSAVHLDFGSEFYDTDLLGISWLVRGTLNPDLV